LHRHSDVRLVSIPVAENSEPNFRFGSEAALLFVRKSILSRNLHGRDISMAYASRKIRPIIRATSETHGGDRRSGKNQADNKKNVSLKTVRGRAFRRIALILRDFLPRLAPVLVAVLAFWRGSSRHACG
jgi:hypothetical protein